MNQQQDIKNTILRNLYYSHFLEDGMLDLKGLCNEEGWDNAIFRIVLDHMLHEKLIDARTIGTNSITPEGIIYSEDHKLVPEELISDNNKSRRLILDGLFESYEAEGPYAEVHYEELSERTGLAPDSMVNLHLLVDLSYVESCSSTGNYKISDKGLDSIKDWKRRNVAAEEFENISKMQPQARGRMFQKFIAKVIEGFGWQQDEGVQTSHEEMDVIVYRDREYYLVECKWEKEPVEAAVIRELHGKLSNRVDVRGIVVSMSGFTSGTTTQVKEYVGSRIILLFGTEDVNSMVYTGQSFDDLLNYKYKELITKRTVLFS